MFTDQFETNTLEKIEAIRQQLRHDGTEPAFFELSTIPPETNLIDYLKKWLHDNGYDYDELLVRSVNRDRLRKAIETGTDRDSNSDIHYLGGVDEEEAAMREAGLNPSTDKGRVTYVSSRSLAKGMSST